jgi:hypothetical protein
LEEETRPWWVKHRELQAVLFHHPNDPEDALGHTLAVAHSLAAAKPVVNLGSDDDEDVKRVVKKEGSGGGNNSENPFASIYSETLIKTTSQHLLLLVGFDTLIYRKYYDTPPILVGHQDYFLLDV